MTSVLTRDGRVHWRATSRRVLGSGPAGAEAWTLTGVAYLIWLALAEPVALDDLVRDLAAVFQQPDDVIREGIEPIVDDMLSRHLIARR